MQHGQVRSGDIVIPHAAIAEHPEFDTDAVLSKLGELGLPASVVIKLKSQERAVELAAYDPETQPKLGKVPWKDFEAFMEAADIITGQRGRLTSRMAAINRYGIGKNGNDGFLDLPRRPVLYSQSTGEAFQSLYFGYHEDFDDIQIDMDALYGYLDKGVTRFFPGIGKGTEADLTQFMNQSIAALPEA